MAYEVFERTAIRVEEPTLSISPDGRIVFNAAATRILNAAKVRNVLLLWDRNAKKFAIKATSKADRNAYTISISGGRTAGLRAMQFLTYLGWRARNRRSLTATWNEKEKMLETILPSEYVGLGKNEPAGRKE